MRVIGVTGGMGSGKTIAVRCFHELGAGIIDADKIANSLLKTEYIKKKILSQFGDSIISRYGIDKKRLAHTVFSKKKQLKDLCRILHPGILKEIRRRIAVSKKKIIVVDAPLLIESGLHREMDKVIVIRAREMIRIKRCQKKGFDTADIRKRMRMQLSGLEKEKYADFIIKNNGSVWALRKQVCDIWRNVI